VPLETVLDRQAAGQIDKIERSSSNNFDENDKAWEARHTKSRALYIGPHAGSLRHIH
jgi:hypothetical protein